MVVIRYVGLVFLLRPRGEYSWIVETGFPKLMRTFLKLMSFFGVCTETLVFSEANAMQSPAVRHTVLCRKMRDPQSQKQPCRDCHGYSNTCLIKGTLESCKAIKL